MVLAFMLNWTMLDVFSGSFFLFIMIFIEPENLSGYGMVGDDSESTKDVIRVEMGSNQVMN